MSKPQPPGEDPGQRDALLDAQRRANQGKPRNFKEDALTDKTVSVEPDGTGPTPTDTFDADKDRALGSGGDDPATKEKPQPKRP